jgi:hypothetical protein
MIFDISEVVDAIGIPANRWNGNCYAIAMALVRAAVVDGDAVYGHYRGTVAADGPWGHCVGHPFIQHGWVITEDGTIVDPTRWCFENVEPYIAVITEDENEYMDYDEGGNDFRQLLRGECPKAQKTDNFFTVELPEDTSLFVNTMLPDGVSHNYLAGSQLGWVANTPYETLGLHAGPLYKALGDMGLIGFVPWDNQQRAKREGVLDDSSL